MKDINDMTVEELEAYIATLPDNSPCSRAQIAKLRSDLLVKKALNNELVLK